MISAEAIKKSIEETVEKKFHEYEVEIDGVLLDLAKGIGGDFPYSFFFKEDVGLGRQAFQLAAHRYREEGFDVTVNFGAPDSDRWILTIGLPSPE